LYSKARGGYGGGHYYSGGHGGGYWGWWWPLAVFGGAAVLAPYYAPYYYQPYYYPSPPVVIQERPPVYVQPAPLSAERIFVYPRNGQSEEQQAKDRYECHSWAVSQTHYDPTQPDRGKPEAQLNQLHADYLRAMDACLDAHGYTMK
jgi:hypothetical protein